MPNHLFLITFKINVHPAEFVSFSSEYLVQLLYLTSNVVVQENSVAAWIFEDLNGENLSPLLNEGIYQRERCLHASLRVFAFAFAVSKAFPYLLTKKREVGKIGSGRTSDPP